MTKVTIDRELLERIDETAICDGTDVTISDDLFTQLVEALAAERQPERDELEKLATSAAQSAPAGEREAYEQWKANMQPYGFNGADAFQAGAAWRRTQAAGVQEGWRDGYRAAMNSAGWGVRELYVKHQHHDRVDGLLNRCKELEQSFIREADAMLAADPALPASPAQPEVQRLRDALEEIADPIKFMRARLEDGEQLNGVYAIQMAESGNYLREIAKRALTASTEQEVEK